MSDQDPFIIALRDWVENSTHRSMHDFIHYNRKSALSLSQTNSLFRLYHRGPCPVNDLADHLGVTMPAVSQLLAPLEDMGLIQRSADPMDRRVKLIRLTDKGANKVQEGMLARHAWLDDLANLITSEEKAELVPALMLLNQYIRALNHHSPRHKTDLCTNPQSRD